MSQYPLLIEPLALEKHLNDKNLLIVDLCKRETYNANHVPGAVHFDYSHIVKIDKPVMGKVPDDD
ncbi:MAG: sulfurtransferase, partial [Gammaproteobacteria bacterium]|nr:sulfurtransferase [Gammaproteobacteria bacterium]